MEELSSKEITVQAESEQEAEKKAEALWKKGNIILDSMDFEQADFYIRSEIRKSPDMQLQMKCKRERKYDEQRRK